MYKQFKLLKYRQHRLQFFHHLGLVAFIAGFLFSCGSIAITFFIIKKYSVNHEANLLVRATALNSDFAFFAFQASIWLLFFVVFKYLPKKLSESQTYQVYYRNLIGWLIYFTSFVDFTNDSLVWLNGYGLPPTLIHIYSIFPWIQV